MKLTPALLFLAVAAPALAQAKPAAKPVVHHTAAAKPAAGTTAKAEGCDAGPALAAAIPKVAGCGSALYSLRFVDTSVGTGDEITPRKWLTVNYTGYLLDGTKFDTSVGKDPITFPYGAHQVITGWDTGFEGMKIGGKRRLYIPYQLAYGEGGRPPVIPAKAALVFDVELLAISENPPAPKTPPAPPAGTPPPAGTTPPAKPASDAPAATGAQPSAQTTVGKPTAAPSPDAKTPAPKDPTAPTTVPPKK